MLTEDDFNDFAAAVGEGTEGSDDDAGSDDFLSWLLVHADTIDPILDFDAAAVTETLEAVDAGVSVNDCGAGNGTRNDSNDSSRRDRGGEGIQQEAEANADESIFATTPFPHANPPFQQLAATLRASTSRPDQNQLRAVGDDGDMISTMEAVTTSETEGCTLHAAAPSFGMALSDPLISEVTADPSLLTPKSAGISPPPADAGAWAGTAVGQGHATSEAHVGGHEVGTVGMTDVALGSLNTALPGQMMMGAGGIPSDPVLAMQMGARMALSGKLGFLPFGIVGDGNMPGVNRAAAAAAASPQQLMAALGAQALGPQVSETSKTAGALTVEPATCTTVAAADSSTPVQMAVPGTNGNLPAWAGLPPPPSYLKPQGPIASNRATCGNVAVKGEAQAAVGISSGCTSNGECGAIGGGVMKGKGCSSRATVATRAEDCVLGGKRLRESSALAADAKAGRDSFKDGRRRRRMSVGELEERVKQLWEDNGRLKLHLSTVNDKLKLMATRKKQMEAEIADKLDAQRSLPSEANKASLAEVLSRFKDLYADYGKHRKQEVEFHLKQLERQIVPTDTTKMSLWTLDQDESFYKDRKRGSLSLILSKELGVSEEQIERIRERRTRIKSLLAELAESLRLVRDLQKSSEAKNSKFEEVMARLQSSFSPQQVARLLLWVSTNRTHISKLPLLPKKMLEQRSLKPFANDSCLCFL